MKLLSDLIIGYIEDNKITNNISYEDSIQSIKELIQEIEQEYKDLKKI